MAGWTNDEPPAQAESCCQRLGAVTDGSLRAAGRFRAPRGQAVDDEAEGSAATWVAGASAIRGGGSAGSPAEPTLLLRHAGLRRRTNGTGSSVLSGSRSSMRVCRKASDPASLQMGDARMSLDDVLALSDGHCASDAGAARTAPRSSRKRTRGRACGLRHGSELPLLSWRWRSAGRRSASRGAEGWKHRLGFPSNFEATPWPTWSEPSGQWKAHSLSHGSIEPTEPRMD